MDEPKVNRAGFLFNMPYRTPEETKAKVITKLPFLKPLPAKTVEQIMPYTPDFMIKPDVAHGIQGPTDTEVSMYYRAVPYTREQMLKHLPLERVIKAGEQLIKKYDVEWLTLGADTKGINKDGGLYVYEALHHKYGVTVTNGNYLTATSGVDGGLILTNRYGYHLDRMTIAVFGAGGSTGKLVARLIAKRTKSHILLVGRSEESDLSDLCKEIGTHRCEQVLPERATRESLLIITATSSEEPINLDPDLLMPGTIIVDIARPRDVAKSVVQKRPDVMVVEGSVLKIPNRGKYTCSFSYGFEIGRTYACMAQGMLEAMLGRHDLYSLGRDLDRDTAEYVAVLAEENGFHLDGFRAFDTPLSEQYLDEFPDRVQHALRSR